MKEIQSPKDFTYAEFRSQGNMKEIDDSTMLAYLYQTDFGRSKGVEDVKR